MPKEQINYPSVTPKLAEEEYATASNDHTTVHVGWNDTGWVQIGMEVEIGYAEFAISAPNGSTDTRTVMYTPVLSPVEIDAMIRTLRRAKLKAYGQNQRTRQI